MESPFSLREDNSRIHPHSYSLANCTPTPSMTHRNRASESAHRLIRGSRPKECASVRHDRSVVNPKSGHKGLTTERTCPHRLHNRKIVPSIARNAVCEPPKAYSLQKRLRHFMNQTMPKARPQRLRAFQAWSNFMSELPRVTQAANPGDRRWARAGAEGESRRPQAPSTGVRPAQEQRARPQPPETLNPDPYEPAGVEGAPPATLNPQPR